MEENKDHVGDAGTGAVATASGTETETATLATPATAAVNNSPLDSVFKGTGSFASPATATATEAASRVEETAADAARTFVNEGTYVCFHPPCESRVIFVILYLYPHFRF
jgi:hypothetical protein